MDNITFIEVSNFDGTTTTYAIIDRGNGEFTSMPKSVYDEMIVNQNQAPILPQVESSN